MINILLVDDHAVVRQGYAALLSMMIPSSQIAEAENAQQTMAALDSQQFDVVILDINLEHSSGLSLAPRIHARNGRSKIIFFSMFDEAAVIHRAMQAGAAGYISKRSKPETMIEAIKSVLKGKTYIEHDLAMKLAAYSYGDDKDISDLLTQREFDVFMGVAKGLSRSKIAAGLNISDKTVSNTVTQLKSKLQVATNTELVHLAIEKGLVKVAS